MSFVELTGRIYSAYCVQRITHAVYFSNVLEDKLLIYGPLADMWLHLIN